MSRLALQHHDPVQNILSLLGESVRKTGERAWQARCPAHDDRSPSLSIGVGDGGRVLLSCHAGCSTESIVASLRMNMSDLFPPKNGNGRQHDDHRAAPPTPRSNGRSYPVADAAVASILRTLGRGWKLVKTWAYHDRAGEVTMRVARFDGPENKKTFRPIHRRRDGWHVGDPAGKLPLYNLPVLSQSDMTVYVVEGEKCADAAASIGLVATTSAHGSKSAHRADWTPLAGRNVVILPDNDDAGRAYASAVKEILAALQPPATVKVVALPDLGDGEDIYDFLEARDSAEPDTLRRQVIEIVEQAGDERATLTMVSAVELCRRHPSLRTPVIHKLLRQGETMNVISAPKIGKSWLSMQLAIAVTTGQPWLGMFQTDPGEVLCIDNELHPETFAYRLRKVAAAMGVDVPKNLTVDTLRGRLRDIIGMQSYFRSIERGRFKMILLDAFYRTLPKDVDENDNGGMTALYNAIDVYAEQLGGTSFVLVHHSTKGIQAGKAVTDVGAGAGAQSRATDTHLVLRQHEEDGAVVIDAAARSWPPLEPSCVRWQFPIWTPAPDLDPTALRDRKPTKQRKEERQEDEGAKVWTPETFADFFLTDQPQPQDLIIARAVQAEIPQRRAEQLLLLAKSDGRAFEWPVAGSRKAHLAKRRKELF